MTDYPTGCTAVEFQVVQLLAVVEGGIATVYDSLGRPLRSLAADKIGIADRSQVVKPLLWRRTVKRQTAALLGRVARNRVQSCDPWQNKSTTLAAAFRQRTREHVRPRTRQRFQHYSTATWNSAAERLYFQSRNRFRYIHRSGWTRWSYTVSNNHNKRMGARYAESRTCVANPDPEAN